MPLHPFRLCSAFHAFFTLANCHTNRTYLYVECTLLRTPHFGVPISLPVASVMPLTPSSEFPMSGLSACDDRDDPSLNKCPDSKEEATTSTRSGEGVLASSSSSHHSFSLGRSPRDARTCILGRAFSRYDLDKSGTIDRNEMRLLLADLGWADDDNSVNRIFRILDEEDEGSLTYEQFMKWTEFAFASRVLYRADMFPHSWNKLLPDEGIISEQVRRRSDTNDPSMGRLFAHPCKSSLGIIAEEGGCIENDSDTLKDHSLESNVGQDFRSGHCHIERGRAFNPSARASNFGPFTENASRHERDGNRYLDLDSNIGNSSDEASDEFDDENQGRSESRITISRADLIAAERMEQRNCGRGSAKVRAKSVGFLCSDAKARLNRAQKMGLNRESRASSKLTAHMQWTVEQFLKSSDMTRMPFTQSSGTRRLDRLSDIQDNPENLPQENEPVNKTVRFYDNIQSNDSNQDEPGNYVCDEEHLRALRARKTK